MIWDLPPRDTFDLLRKLYAIPPDQYADNLDQFTDLLDLHDVLDRPVRLLSLGQRMRCEIVAALLHDPPLLYLDEPTIGLDAVAKERMQEFILHLNRERGTTVMLTTHDLSDIEALCERLIIIDKGRIIYDGSLTTLRQNYGRLRRILFSVADDIDLHGIERIFVHDGTKVEIQGDRSVVVSFDPQVVEVSEITRQIVNTYPITDLTVEAADLRSIIRQLYRQGTTDA